MPRKFYRVLLRRRILIIALLILQLALILYFIVSGSKNSVWIEYALTVISVVVAFHVIGKSGPDAYKLMWVVLILAFPVFGGLFYLLITSQRSPRRILSKAKQLEQNSRPLFFLPGDCFDYACSQAPEYTPQMRYLQQYTGFPVYRHTATAYLSPGEAKFARLVEALKKAEKYIFLEYFIIREGLMWNTVLEILKQKAAAGVDVRVMYDDVGCFLLLPKDYPQYLEAMGIQCLVFNPFRPFLTAIQNNRDHRKIAVIDGKTAFTGGINLGDEYINATERFGHWKDASIRVEGDAAWSFTMIFLQMWDMCRGIEEDIASFYPCPDGAKKNTDDGLVQPYADTPMDDEPVGRHVYVQIINKAKHYIYINTPYLIIDESVVSALTLAAKSGVDVRIVTPHQPDKWLVHMTTRSYYRELVSAGVKIYEYTAGFMHSKTFVSDDEIATVGSTNVDYRSMYLHFECGVWMYGSKAVKELHDDFVKTLEHCRRITEEDCQGNSLTRMVQDVLRLFAPLM